MEGQKNDLEYLQTWSWIRLMGFPMAIRAAVQLNVFNIIADFGNDAHLSAAEIVSLIPGATHPDSASVLDRILRNLAANSFLSSYLRQNPNGQETCIPKQPDSLTAPRGHDGNLTFPETPVQQLDQYPNGQGTFIPKQPASLTASQDVTGSGHNEDLTFPDTPVQQLDQYPNGQGTFIPKQPDSLTATRDVTGSRHDENLTFPDTPVQQLDQSVTDVKDDGFSSWALPDSPAVTRVYGLTKESRCLVSSPTGLSLAPAFLFSTEREVVDGMYKLKDAVLDPDCLVSGESFFDRLSGKPEMSSLFNEVMANSSRIFFREVLEVYGGLEGLEELMDVGGGVGTSLGKIVSKYPRIRGINFDMPHVIAEAPNYPGVDHVAGDMFNFLRKAETIILKWILHDWDDEKCKKLLRNCWEALPKNGKVIVLEFAIPEKLENEYTTWNVIAMDFIMLTLNPGGKERTVAEFQALAMASGFVETKVCVTTKGIHVMELLKKSS